MTTYRYKGQTPEGSKVSGVIRAYDEYDAVSKLRDTCAFVIKLEEVREKKDSVLTRPLRTKIKEKDLALICSQFSIILGTGLPVMRCVEMVAAQNRNKHLARMLHKVAEDIGAGYSMAQSFESNIPGLPKTFVETVRAGEQSGALEACFKRLYKYYDKSAKTRAKIVSTMTYPVMVIVTAIIVFAIIMVVAVPAFTSAFAELGTDLPAVTRWLMSTSAFLTRWWWLILFILALLTIGYLSFKRTERGKLAIASYALRRAPLRRLHTLHLSGQFASTMATMLSAGLPVQTVLGIVSQISDNYVFSLGVRKVKEGVERGRGIADSMEGVECFPKMLTEMVAVGERSGSLEETLDVIGDYFDHEAATMTERLLAVLEPVIIIVLAAVTVMLLLAVYLPMFSMYGSI